MPVDPTTTPIAGDPDSFPEEGFLPTDATKSFSSRYNSPVEVLYDRTAWQRARDIGEKPLPLNGASDAEGYFTRIDVPSGSGRFGYLQTSLPSGGTTPVPRLSWYVDLPAHLIIVALRAHIMGDDGSGTNTSLPSLMPKIRIYDQTMDGQSASLGFSATDPSGTLGVYDAYHNWKLTISTHVSYLVPVYRIIEFTGHGGGGAAADTLKLLGIEYETALKP